MKAWRACVVSAIAATVFTGCYMESIDERAPGPPGEPMRKTDRQKEPGACRLTLNKGCFDGYVVSTKTLYVQDTEFFNADNLANRFQELIVVYDEDGLALTAGQDYKLVSTTAIDNRGFLSGFSYDLTGEVNRRDVVRPDGSFRIDELPEGRYDLRLHRPIKFEVMAVSDADRNDADTARAAEPVKKTYCATLYLDTVVDVRGGERASENFNDFKLHVSEHECATSGTTTSLRWRR